MVRSVPVNTAAAMMGVSRRTIYNMMRDGRLSFVTIRKGKGGLGGQSCRVTIESIEVSPEFKRQVASGSMAKMRWWSHDTSSVSATSWADSGRRVIVRPECPRNRVLHEGESPCIVCGSGKADHVHRDHPYTSPLMALLTRLRWRLQNTRPVWYLVAAWRLLRGR